MRSLTPGSITGKLFVDMVMWSWSWSWSWSGRRNDRGHEALLSAMSVPGHLAGPYPPAFVTVGNVDPLLGQSERPIARIQELGVETESPLVPPDHTAALSHEYHFDLALDDARTALAAIARFVERTVRAELHRR